MKTDLFYDKLYQWVLNVAPKLAVAIIALIAGVWLIRWFKKWLKNAFLKKKINASFRPFLTSFIIIAVQVLLVLGIMQILGIQLTIFTTIIGAVSVAAGLALSGTLQNFASGVLILLLKPFKQGDNIIAQGQDGIVSSIQLFYTVVITFDNRTVIIPYSKLSNEVIINISKLGKRRMDVELKFNYGFDFEKIKSIMQQTLKTSSLSLDEPEPSIVVSTLDTDGFKLMIKAWVKADDFENSKYTLQQKLVEDLKSQGIKLPGMT